MGRPELDLEVVARTEASNGDLFSLLGSFFQPASQKGAELSDAVIWQYGNCSDGVAPVAHSLTDAFALLGTLEAVHVLGLPCLAVPMWAQYRHDTKLAPLRWFGQLPQVAIKWSTAGDTYVSDGNGGRVVVMGKSGNAKLRTDAGVFCNERPYGPITVIRSMPGLPYSQSRERFCVTERGIVHSEMNSPGVQMAYAIRHFLCRVNETGCHGRVAFKPTQGLEDGILSGLLSWMLQGTSFEIGRKFAVDGYEEHRESVDRIVALLPADFKAGMEQWRGTIDQHISDTAYGLLVNDLIDQRQVIYLATDLDGDRLTDLLADISDPLRKLIAKTAKHLGHAEDTSLWNSMGYVTGNGRDMTSVMYRINGAPIYEQTLGSADEMLRRLLAGKETANGKRPYDPRIHFCLIVEAYKAANPQHQRLHSYLDDALRKFDAIYSSERPSFFEGHQKLQQVIAPWS